MSVTKKSNALDKPKPNILNSAAKKLQNHANESVNNNSNNKNNSNNDGGADINDSAPHKTNYKERDVSPPPMPAPATAVPEVTVCEILEIQLILLLMGFLTIAS